MGHCKDCRWWVNDNELRFKKVIAWNECGAIDMTTTKGVVTGAGALVYADAADDTNLSAMLMTGPMFGCVLFEQENGD